VFARKRFVCFANCVAIGKRELTLFATRDTSSDMEGAEPTLVVRDGFLELSAVGDLILWSTPQRGASSARVCPEHVLMRRQAACTDNKDCLSCVASNLTCDW
jgi:hypothetical protein